MNSVDATPTGCYRGVQDGLLAVCVPLVFGVS